MKLEACTDKYEGKDKKLMEMLESKGKPFVRKCDGFAVKVEEDVEIEYKDHQDQENILKVPKGSYVVKGTDDWSPKIVTADEFDGKNSFMKEPKKAKAVHIGIGSMMDD